MNYFQILSILDNIQMMKNTTTIKILGDKKKNFSQSSQELKVGNDVEKRAKVHDLNYINEKLKKPTSKEEVPFTKNPENEPHQLSQSKQVNASGEDEKAPVSMIRRLFQKITGSTFVCQICLLEHKETDKTSVGNCDHFFCKSCLEQHVTYKVGKFEEVVCPKEECSEGLGMEGRLFISLPADIQKRYSRISFFHAVSKDPNTRLCPNENCEFGVLALGEHDKPPTCSKCGKSFCQKCFFTVHQGPCEKSQLQFFQNKLHYRQCSQCKSVIEKIQGCSHMTCRCGFSFCFTCGQKLEVNHQCPLQDRIVNNNNNISFLENVRVYLSRGDCPAICLKIIVMALIILPAFVAAQIFLAIKMILITVLYFLMAIIAGMVLYTCEFIWNEHNGPMNVVLTVLYPIVMFVGIGRAFQDFFRQAVPQEWGNYTQAVADSTQNMLCW